MSLNTSNKKKVWALRYTPGNCDADTKIGEIARTLSVSEVTARLIYNRGYRDAASAALLLSPDIALLHDPYILADMDRAVERVLLSVDRGERITVYGDYDVDGVTSVTLLYLYLKSLGACVDYYIPLRAKEGYGVSSAAVDSLAGAGTKLMITVDTGITANREVEYARGLGIDTVVTDHHECHGELPSACAVVNPQRPDCKYPFRALAGVGVVFKLVCALEIARCPDISAADAVRAICDRYIDLVAVGTVADVMPLIDENRVIVKLGLAAINDSARVGLAALIEAANSSSGSKGAAGSAEKNQKKRKINSGYISFSLAPRINAAGRISSATKAVELLLCSDADRARTLAEELCEINLRRQREENSIAEEAYNQIEASHDFEKDRIIVLENNSWQQGIIGIVSSRITEKYGLPSILISFDGAMSGKMKDDDIGKGSGRSIKGLNLVDALDYCRASLVQFGGHELAAGLSVKRMNIPLFRVMINDYARKHLSDDLFVMKCEADCALEAEELSMDIVDEISLLEPFGVANPAPLFLLRDMSLDRVISMGGGKHSKLVLSSGGKGYSAVCFGMPSSSISVHFGERVDLICQLSINEFRGQRSLQLIVQDIALSEEMAKKYQKESERYREISGGGSFSLDEDVIPTRAEVAHVYKFLRYEGMCGRSSLSLRALHCALLEQQGVDISILKLRLILDILEDMRVCELDAVDSESFEFEICKNAAKSNIELTDTYKMLEAGLRA